MQGMRPDQECMMEEVDTLGVEGRLLIKHLEMGMRGSKQGWNQSKNNPKLSSPPAVKHKRHILHHASDKDKPCSMLFMPYLILE